MPTIPNTPLPDPTHYRLIRQGRTFGDFKLKGAISTPSGFPDMISASAHEIPRGTYEIEFGAIERGYWVTVFGKHVDAR